MVSRKTNGGNLRLCCCFVTPKALSGSFGRKLGFSFMSTSPGTRGLPNKYQQGNQGSKIMGEFPWRFCTQPKFERQAD